MPVFPRLFSLLVLGLLAGLILPVQGAEATRHLCLTKAEQRAAVASHRAVSLGRATQAARKHVRRGELLRARLCRRGERLVYVLTLLARNGKVTRVSVDAATGGVIGGH